MTQEVGPLYDRIAVWFDENRDRSLSERVYLDTLTQKLPRNASLLDLGCGMAEPIASYFIQKGFTVTGVDISAPMIAYCQERFPDMTWHCADMRTTNMGQTFDVLIAWDSFFHLPQDDQRRMFSIFKHHAHTGTYLLFNTGGKADESYGTMDGLRFYHASLNSDDYRALAQEHGFTILKHTPDDAACGGRTVWLMQAIS